MLRQRSAPTAIKRGHSWSVPGRAKFNQSSVIARRNERFNFQLAYGMAHLLGTAGSRFFTLDHPRLSNDHR